jgi:hypothetical protein
MGSKIIGLHAAPPAIALFLQASIISSKVSWSCVRSRAFLNLLHLSISNSKAILNEGTVLPIEPREKNGSNNPQNGIGLCLLHHWAFDNGLFSIKNDYSIIVEAQLRESFNYVLAQPAFFSIEFQITEFHVITLSLAISLIAFVFAAIRFASSSAYIDSCNIDRNAKPAYSVFRLGFVFMLFSLSLVMIATDLFLGVISIAVILCIFSYYSKR